ncbi:MAG: Dam family site-specific DNA-(adenine-N6)-methyltransferase [Deltaproteobacteria bacterium]|nr:Dam family site-specific DNA-(adenine-N6)-methyltransferase [Deltaproteobacteria bacterium]
MTTETNKKIFPFLKWAGGKRWLINHYSDLFPQNLSYYIEPFLGGGAIFFALQPQRALLSDINNDLIDAYLAVKQDWISLKLKLLYHHEHHSDKHYYMVRGSSPSDLIDRAARFIYLNRTCWNGLYRVNKQGEFNVPIGTKDKVIMDSDDFPTTSLLLNKCTIVAQDFSKSIDCADDKTFLFVDPPYTVRHNNNNFRKYNEELFSWGDQVRLRDKLFDAKKRGAKVMVCNANHPSIIKLYHGFGSINRVNRHSVLSAKPEFRCRTTEAVICSY